jgi:hypothetical protein
MMNQEVSGHAGIIVARNIMIEQRLAAVLAILEPRQRAPSILHQYVAEGGVQTSAPDMHDGAGMEY